MCFGKSSHLAKKARADGSSVYSFVCLFVFSVDFEFVLNKINRQCCVDDVLLTAKRRMSMLVIFAFILFLKCHNMFEKHAVLDDVFAQKQQQTDGVNSPTLVSASSSSSSSTSSSHQSSSARVVSPSANKPGIS